MNKEKSDSLKQKIRREVIDFVAGYAKEYSVATKWETPMTGFADAAHPNIRVLKEIVSPTHNMPEDVLPDARVVLSYYIPFTRELAKTNAEAGRLAAPEWALAYEETNAMFVFLNAHLIAFLEELGYRAAVPQASKTFDWEKLKSDWSQRHMAYAAGLGTFGVNNMLITKNGCCGRYNSIVTNLDVEPDAPLAEELCLYKKNGSCLVCVKNCPVGALTTTGYNRKICYALTEENAAIHTEFGSSYQDGKSNNPGNTGSHVCAKCVTASPCAHIKTTLE